MRRFLPLATVLISFAGCAAPGEAGTGPLTVDVGAWTASILDAEVESGWSEVAFTLSDADDQPVTALDVVADLWMPAHGHGTTDEVTVEETGPGDYLVRGNFIMPGQWEVTSVLAPDVPDLVFFVEAVSE